MRQIRRLLPARHVHVWHHRDYRIPLTMLESVVGFETRRADWALTAMVDEGAVRHTRIHSPRRIRYSELEQVHTSAYLESLDRSEVLGRIFGVETDSVPVSEILSTIRLACGGTLAAARFALRHGAVTMNLLGGFHHASPDKGGGLCALNDIAVALACLRLEGFSGRVAILDLDAHPPDGLADCFRDDDRVWIGSISGADWGPLPGVDETLLPEGTGDKGYLEALDALLSRTPQTALTFVIAGGDVLDGDRMGTLAMSMDGARQRDIEVARALSGRAQVWLPGGGYFSDSWRLLTGTALALSHRSKQPISTDYSPMSARFERLSARLNPEKLEGEAFLTEEDLFGNLGGWAPQHARMLGFYTAEGMEYALSRFGILAHLRRLGYDRFRVAITAASEGDRACLYGEAGGQEHLLIEVVLEKKVVDGHSVLYVHWLTLRHPAAEFSDKRPRLPGQEVPGLGLAMEMGELLGRVAHRLLLEGVAFRPAHFHVAFTARERFRFIEPRRHGRFEALIRDLGHLPLLEVTRAVRAGRVLLDGEVYGWEAEPMIAWLEPSRFDAEAAGAEAEAVTFSLSEG